MVIVWRCFGETWDFSFTFCIFPALQEFCTGVVSLDRSPRYSKLLCKRIGFIRYHGTFIFCGCRFCMRIMLMSVPWAHSCFAPCPAVCCFGACAGDVPILCLRCTQALFFLVSVKKLDDQEMRYPYESIINWMRFSLRYCRIWRQHQTHNKPCKLSPVT